MSLRKQFSHESEKAMLEQPTLNLTSTLRELPAWETQLELTCMGDRLVELFEREQSLPGVMLTQDQHYRGMISRRRFLEVMSRPYSQEIFRQRSLAVLYG
ncbi:MAG: ATPase, partial [Phormidesmis sp. CAN_BIN44]|nr:ATPase [Phormidesmis sp. CAN_BIN44]